jgi:predicted alpha/beta-hydrolase family hydrolase
MLSHMAEILPFETDEVSGFLHPPDQPLNQGIVLTHGAGANCQAPLLVTLASAFASAGFLVLRCDLPFRQRKRFGPPHPAHAAQDRNGLRAAMIELRRLISGRSFLAGHSYGGRQASMLAAEDPSVADGLLLLSYPLHPPDKPEQLRTAHFADLHVPALFVHGTKDPFGSTEELSTALRLISAVTNLFSIEGAGHDLKRGKSDISADVVARLLSFFSVSS